MLQLGYSTCSLLRPVCLIARNFEPSATETCVLFSQPCLVHKLLAFCTKGHPDYSSQLPQNVRHTICKVYKKFSCFSLPISNLMALLRSFGSFFCLTTKRTTSSPGKGCLSSFWSMHMILLANSLFGLSVSVAYL